MRAAPAFDIELPREPAWLVVCALLGALAAASAAVWAGDGAAWRWWVSAATTLGFGAWWIGAWRRPPQELRWDGHDWWLQPVGSPAGRTGRLAVALDLDAWLLMRFEVASVPRRRRWLAASRRGLGTDWPALRRAVYCARPAETEFTANDPSA